MKTLILLAALPFALFAADNAPKPPKSSDPRIIIELIAEAPDIVTPTGLGVDAQGRVIVIESHTHFRPKDYKGPERDRVLMFTPSAKGKAKRSIFYEGLKMGMDVCVGKNDWVYLAERSRILRVRDTNNDGKADKTEDIITLKTTGDYPHNGLSGLSFDPKGNLIFGLGENLGHAYTMLGSDGEKIEGAAGIGGGVFRCSAEGKKLKQIARGFWNPFGTCVDKWDRIFAVDNDPGNRPPCRLLHVVQNGDYGYRYKFGRTGLHPFLAWDGELLGTLPMIHGTGEAPCEVIFFDSPTFPQEYRGRLLVTSWGDQRIESYQLKRKGTSVSATMIPLIQGGDTFRPVGLAMAPDGSLYLSDWGSSSYNLNKKGRLWRIRPVKNFKAKPLVNLDWPKKDQQSLANIAKKKFPLNNPKDYSQAIKQAANNTDPFLRHVWLGCLNNNLEAHNLAGKPALKFDGSQNEKAVLLHALLRHSILAKLFGQSAPHPRSPTKIQFEFLRWAADTKQVHLRPEIEANLSAGPADYNLFRAYLACLDELNGRANPDRFNEKFALPLLEKADTPDTLRGHVLRYFPDDHKAINSKKLIAWMGSENKALQREAIWKMRAHLDESANAVLRTLALDDKQPLDLRLAATAVFGVSESPDSATLLEIAKTKNAELRAESLRSLVGAHFEVDGQKQLAALNTPAANRAMGKPFIKNPPDTKDTAAWLKRIDALDGNPNAATGERIFFNHKIATCGSCHQVNERGTRVGPDLTRIARGASRARILESILQPNKEVSPYLRAWVMTMKDGKVHTGIAMRRGGNSEVYLGIDGKEIRLDKRQIKSKTEGHHSLMPEGLVHTMTLSELRDLLAFLLAR
jgi:hypothetical protein